jgi:peroxiredoxin
MSGKLNVGIKAPDFTLAAVDNGSIHLAAFQDKKIILLCLIRGFA